MYLELSFSVSVYNIKFDNSYRGIIKKIKIIMVVNLLKLFYKKDRIMIEHKTVKRKLKKS